MIHNDQIITYFNVFKIKKLMAIWRTIRVIIKNKIQINCRVSTYN